MKLAAIYTRVSSDQQKEAQTIDSQVAALMEYAHKGSYQVPEQWVFRDEAYSGSILRRPGLDRIRDLAAEQQLEAVLIYAPDRLSRNYAYQVIFIEELNAQGVEVVFMNAPQGDSPESALLLQFQGMIAEYERALIRERSRRGKRHKAKSGCVNVLSGAPYGYRYVKKVEHRAAYYEIIDSQASVVQEVYRLYTEELRSIGDVTRWLDEQNIPTRKEKSKLQKSIDKLLDAYQEHLIPLSELRKRVPSLRKREATLNAELNSLEAKALYEEQNQATIKDIERFLTHLRLNANKLDIENKRKILQLLVKEILVGDHTIIIKHCIKSKGGEVGKMTKVTFCVGGVLSPLLANIYLNLLDRIVNNPLGKYTVQGMQMIRYVDDFIIMARQMKKESVDKVHELLKRMELKINETKSELIKAKEKLFDFLGFTVRYDRSIFGKGKRFWNISPSQKSRKKIRQKINAKLKQIGHYPPQKVANELNPIIRGWQNYYRIEKVSATQIPFKELEDYLRDRLFRYYNRKSQRRTCLHGQQAFDMLVEKYGLIKPYGSSGLRPVNTL